MPYYHRKQPRLDGYDYSQPNFYYVTVCTKDHRCLFGDPEELNQCGQVAQSEMQKLVSHYNDVAIDKFVIMPNHIHAIIAIGCQEKSGKRPSLSTVVGLYKSTVSRRIHEFAPELDVWQVSFYDEIIRDEKHYLAVWNYIDGNPLKWDENEHRSP